MPCLSLEAVQPKQSIISSKSFSQLQTDYQALSEALSSHVARAWEKMRQQGLTAQYLSIFITSNPFRKDLPQYRHSTGFKLLKPSDDIRHLTLSAKTCLKQIFKAGIHYKKIGVLFDGLIPKSPTQEDWLSPASKDEGLVQEALMRTIERVNKRFGRHALKLAAEGYAKPWAMKRDLKSPSYTTQWHELPRVNTSPS